MAHCSRSRKKYLSSCSRSLQIASVMKTPIVARLSNNTAWNWEVRVARFYPAVEENREWGCVGVSVVCVCVDLQGREAVSNTAAAKKNPDVPSDWYGAALLNVLQTQSWQELRVQYWRLIHFDLKCKTQLGQEVPIQFPLLLIYWPSISLR